MWKWLICVAFVPFASPVFAKDAVPKVAEKKLSDLENLFLEFKAVKSFKATFREEKRIALLTEPLLSTGSVTFCRPDRLIRKTDDSTLVLFGSALEMSTSAGVQRVDLQQGSAVHQLVSGFMHLFAGDTESIKQIYECILQRTAGGWLLVLRPRSQGLSALIESLSFDGRGARVERAVVRETNGDQSTTSFQHASSASVPAECGNESTKP